jgi:predicted MFS family arabinose efflux permease
MPVAIAVGRRIVLLVFTLILILAAVLCAKAENYEWHLGARMVLGLCAGQSEALVPMITQVHLRELQHECEGLTCVN